MSTVTLSLLMGVALAAACGFRVFLPMFVLSLAVAGGHVQVGPGFVWLGQWPAMLTLGVATVLEIGAYYIPWLDHLLDAIASPAAIIAGTLVSASFITGMDPWLRWTLAAILGGGAAGTVQLATVATRAVSTATTGGLANPIVSTFEWLGAALTALLAVLAPLLAVALFLLVLALLVTWLRRHRWVRASRAIAPAAHLSAPSAPLAP